jgi:hypothetical protein
LTTIPNVTKYVPSPDKYNLTTNWATKKIKHEQKANKAPVNSFITQIYHKAKSPEKRAPSPTRYKKAEAWANTSLKAAMRVTGGEKLLEERTTYLAEVVSMANETPGPKYPNMDLVSTYELLIFTIIGLI